MTIPPDPRDEPLIPRKWAPIFSALATVIASLLVWLVQLAGQVDERIKDLEVTKGHLVDEAGNVRPSSTASANRARIRALEAQVDLMRKKLGI